MTRQTNSDAIKDEPELRRVGLPNDAVSHQSSTSISRFPHDFPGHRH